MKKKDLRHQVTSFNDKIRLWTCHKHLSKNKIYARQTVINWKQILFLMNLKISMVSSDLWTEIDVRLSEIFSLSNALLFAGFSVVTIRNYLQLTPVRGRSIFSWFTGASRMNQLLSLQLWHLYKKNAKLTEIVTQIDQTFTTILNSARLRTVNENTEKLLKAQFTYIWQEDAWNIYAENTPIVLRNQTVVNVLPSAIYSTEASDKIQYDCRYPFSIIQVAQNLKKKDWC